MSTQPEPPQLPLELPQPALDLLLRAVAFNALAGFAAGTIAGGVGSRIAMRISAVAAGSAKQGTITEFEATVGEITAGGTMFLILAGGLVGVMGGLIYLALRPWVADAGRWRGLVFGVSVVAIFGPAIIAGDNPDFHRFGPPALNITMFASFFILFGLLVVPLSEWMGRIARALPPPSLQRSGLPSLAGHAFGLLLLLPAVGGIGLVASGAARIFLPYTLLVIPITALLIGRTVGRFDRLSDLRGHWGAMAAALAVVALPVAGGIALNVLAITDIFEAAG